jgi:hypothetical protein
VEVREALEVVRAEEVEEAVEEVMDPYLLSTSMMDGELHQNYFPNT